MRFINPKIFYWLILLLPLAAALVVRAGRRRREELARLLGRSDRTFAVRLSPAARRFRLLLIAAAMVLLVVAGARPYWSSQLLQVA